MVKSVLLPVCTNHKDAKSVVNLLTLRIIAGTIVPIDTEHPVDSFIMNLNINIKK